MCLGTGGSQPSPLVGGTRGTAASSRWGGDISGDKNMFDDILKADDDDKGV